VTAVFLPRDRLDDLVVALGADGRRVLGPTVAGGAIVVDEIKSAADLPAGRGDEAAPGRYRLMRRSDSRVFAHASGPHSWKPHFFPARETLLEATRVDGRVTFRAADAGAEPLAFLGVRACDLAAIGVQDRVFTATAHVDPHYRQRRSDVLVVAVECTHPASTCFCTSMGTGPEVAGGADLVLVELDGGFVARAGTRRGEALLDEIGCEMATQVQLEAATSAVAHAAEQMPVDVRLLAAPAILATAQEHPRWVEVAQRCLACTNCTLACPTCFCNGITHRSNLDATEASVERHWDSCFTLGFAQVSGGNFRVRVRDRYRQWLTHKFSTWHEQFGSTGCTGCGRCITWCPVGIDVREEVAAIVGDVTPVPDVAAATDTSGLGLHLSPTVTGTDVEVPVPVGVTAVVRETRDTVTLRIDATAAKAAGFDAPLPGQFVLATVPGVGAPPISVSRVRESGDFELTVRSVGPATAALSSLREGATLGVTPPRGRPWPLDAAEGRDVVVVGGGIGLAPVRPVVDAVLGEPGRYGRLRLYVGARSPDDLVFGAELPSWMTDPRLDCSVTVDRAPEGWHGQVGLVTHLFDHGPFVSADSCAFVCGPEVMMMAVLRSLRELGLADDRIWLTTERHMDCGVGLCGHCQLGPFLVCRDGPVFSAAELGRMLEVEGI